MSSSNTGASGSPMPSDMKEDESPCHLLKLSPELRNIIYQESLIHTKILVSNPLDNLQDKAREESEPANSTWEFHSLFEPALLRTCKQIRQEALPIFYGGNTFRSSTKDLYLFTFINRLTPAKRLMLRNLQISGHYRWSCVHGTRKWVEKMREQLREEGVHVPSEAIYIPAKVANGEDEEWARLSEVDCEVPTCYCGASRPL